MLGVKQTEPGTHTPNNRQKCACSKYFFITLQPSAAELLQPSSAQAFEFY